MTEVSEILYGSAALRSVKYHAPARGHLLHEWGTSTSTIVTRPSRRRHRGRPDCLSGSGPVLGLLGPISNSTVTV